MAPQKHSNQEDLQAPLIPSEQQQIQSSLESLSEQSSASLLLGDQLDVVIVQPEGNALLTNEEDIADMRSNKSDIGGAINKGGKKEGIGGPVNCPHLETMLFFFGIAGMIVSVLMLLQHIIGNLISYS